MKLPLNDFAEVVDQLRGSATKSTAAEQRQSSRIAVWAKLDIHLLEAGEVGRCFSALTRDISLTGLGILQSVALPARHEVIITLPRQAKPLFVVGTVMHCRSMADGVLAVGLEFSRIADSLLAKQLLADSSDLRARLQKSVLS